MRRSGCSEWHHQYRLSVHKVDIIIQASLGERVFGRHPLADLHSTVEYVVVVSHSEAGILQFDFTAVKDMSTSMVRNNKIRTVTRVVVIASTSTGRCRLIVVNGGKRGQMVFVSTTRGR
jgi:hypothetical protein